MTEADKEEVQALIDAAIPNPNLLVKAQRLTVSSGCTETNPYIFQVKEDIENTQEAPKDVTLVIPIGGVESGLYRSPKKGESVLVGVLGGATSSYYLMGYLPDSISNNFGHKKSASASSPDSDQADMKTLLDDKGEVFRYKQTGKKAGQEGNEPYSEIGFYQKTTAWKPGKDAAPTYANAPEAGGGQPAAEQEDYPKIDRIKIHSTGDIHESAVNHHQVKAARLEMLVGKDVETEAETFKRGDIRIKAEKDITIEAGGTITIKVGRTTLTIKDTGFTLTSKLSNSEIPNSYDAGITVTPRSGFSAFGLECKIAGIKKAMIGDSMGGELSTGLGVLSIKGREMKMATYNAEEYLGLTIFANLDLAQNIIAAGFTHSDDKKAQEITSLVFAWVEWLKNLVEAGRELYGDYKDLQELRAKAVALENKAMVIAGGKQTEADDLAQKNINEAERQKYYDAQKNDPAWQAKTDTEKAEAWNGLSNADKGSYRLSDDEKEDKRREAYATTVTNVATARAANPASSTGAAAPSTGAAAPSTGAAAPSTGAAASSTGAAAPSTGAAAPGTTTLTPDQITAERKRMEAEAKANAETYKTGGVKKLP
jgi:hypothetical protein